MSLFYLFEKWKLKNVNSIHVPFFDIRSFGLKSRMFFSAGVIMQSRDIPAHRRNLTFKHMSPDEYELLL